jgi:hypothetical protein
MPGGTELASDILAYVHYTDWKFTIQTLKFHLILLSYLQEFSDKFLSTNHVYIFLDDKWIELC